MTDWLVGWLVDYNVHVQCSWLTAGLVGWLAISSITVYLEIPKASLQVLDESTAQLWWAGKELQRGKKLQDYIGKNEKSKLICKFQKVRMIITITHIHRTHCTRVCDLLSEIPILLKIPLLDFINRHWKVFSFHSFHLEFTLTAKFYRYPRGLSLYGAYFNDLPLVVPILAPVWSQYQVTAKRIDFQTGKERFCEVIHKIPWFVELPNN